jgi:molybdate transport system permease protein
LNRFDRILAVPLIFFSLLVPAVVFALVKQISMHDLMVAIFHPETFFALRFSLMTSVMAMTIAIVVGIPSAYFMARSSFPFKNILETILELPLVMPPLIVGVGLLFLLGQGMLGDYLAKLGISFIFTPLGAVAAQAFIATPIVMKSARAAFSSVDIGYEESAQTLGLNPLTVFIKVNIPLAGKSLLSGLVLAWARTMGEFGGTLMVAGATRFRTETLPIAVYLNISSGETGIAISCALVLLVTAFALLLVSRIFSRNGGNGGRGGYY